MADEAKSEQEYHAQQLAEKPARDGRMQTPHNWPHDENGEPMAIIMCQASELAPTVKFGNVTIGPVGAMVPCKNDYKVIEAKMREMQKLAEYIIGTERRLIQWSLDPSSKIIPPKQEVEGETSKS